MKLNDKLIINVSKKFREIDWKIFSYFFKDADEENALTTSSDKNLIITTTETSTKLTINNVTKKHRGKYTLIITNDSGSDTAKGELKILDRPEPPEGLTASVDGDKCVLMWKRSKDDGGSPIEHYQVFVYFRLAVCLLPVKSKWNLGKIG